MSAQLHDVGSILDFWPAPPAPPLGPNTIWVSDVAGVALVVVKRSNWVITTELRAVRVVDGRYVIDQTGDPRA